MCRLREARFSFGEISLLADRISLKAMEGVYDKEIQIFNLLVNS